jgi:uncharacterized damage-inducible protein DinB
MRVMLCSAVAVALATVVVGAQAGGAAKAGPKSASTAAANPLSDALRSQWKSVKTYYLKSADEMPDENYGFKPVDTVRSFGEIIAHVAGANYSICSAAKGEKPPHGEDEFVTSAKTRDAIIKVAHDSVAYCDSAFAAATDETLSKMVASPFSANGKQPLGAVLVDNIGHVNEHYGNLVTYLRIKGLVPPSSQPSR